ncbi:MAG TPA: peptidoglycan-binding protein [Herpetosiphonaceae bacterium]
MRRIWYAALAFALCALLGSPTASFALSWPIESVGDSGPNVYSIQHLLNARGFTLTADGAFGPTTESKVKSFQSSRGLTADGIVGPNTWEALIITVQSGSSGEAAKAAQRQLNKYGYALAVDGAFGPASVSATRDYQSKHGLTADGIIGPATWSSLTSGSSGGGTSRAQLAATIRDSSRVALLTYHVSGISDSASTARQNIVDTANGLAAKTSSYSDVGRTSVYLNTTMLNTMVKLANTYGYTYRVTEIAGGDHSSTSRHYVGVAFDVDMINGSGFSSRTTNVSNFMQRCRDNGATEVLGPGDAGHSTHIHCAWPRP